MSAKIKICGITRLSDARKCIDCGVDFIGLVFAESPRRISIDEAARIAERAAGKVMLVGVFERYDADRVARVVDRVKLDFIQVYYDPEDEPIVTPPLPLVSSVWMGEHRFKLPPYPCRYLLLDFKRAGSINAVADYDWKMLKKRYNVFLAGGINPENVSGILESYRPFGIDAARGTEKEPGIKDWSKIEGLVERVRSWSK